MNLKIHLPPKKRRLAILGFLILALCGMVAAASIPTGRRSAAKRNEKAPAPAAPVDEGASGAKRRSGTEPVPEKLQLATGEMPDATFKHFTGQDVYSSDRRYLGAVKDFIIDAASGNVTCAIVYTGGFFGLGDHLYLVPIHAMKFSVDRFTLPVSKAEWVQSPSLDEKDYEQGLLVVHPGELQKLEEIYHQRPGGLTGHEQLRLLYVRASRLEGRTVHSGLDGELGRIKSIVIDPDRGKAAALLVPAASVAGESQNVFVPLSRLQVSWTGADAIGTDLRLAELRRVAGVSPEASPRLSL
ncbi:MAG TPA: PRC-barrel domain-containing protein [Lacunisphaera sp.]|jgi:sporulation protein YlmC with PRC-barrel domain|nr:PRC-barrel domain-containing protein [Lacunisphaera sp.]